MRAGVSLLEALLALLLLAVVVQGAWAVVARTRTAGAYLSQEAQGLETIRTTGWLLPVEVSGGRAGRDWRWEGGDSLPLRAFRGLAIVLGPGSREDRLSVCFRGMRSPDPDKDSVLVMDASGSWIPHSLSAREVEAPDCPEMEGGRAEVWTLSPPAREPILGRLFERGSYHIIGRALRYRRGFGGRQPLTPERIDEGRFGGPGSEAGGPFWEILLSGAPGRTDSLPWRGSLR